MPDVDSLEPDSVQSTEVLSRWLFSSKLFNRSTLRVRSGAFTPQRSLRSGDLETSVYRTSGLTEHQIWPLAQLRPGLTLHGRADLKANDVETTGLTVVPETSNHPRHANILGWSDDEADQLQKKTELARMARLLLKDDNN